MLEARKPGAYLESTELEVLVASLEGADSKPMKHQSVLSLPATTVMTAVAVAFQ